MVFEVADYESIIRFSKFKMANPIWRMKIHKVSKLDENRYIEVIGITDYESIIRFQKFKMADPIWRMKIHKVSKLDENRYIEFLRSLITNPLSDF